MRNHKMLKVLALSAIALMGSLPSHAGDTTTSAPARMTVTVQTLGENKRTPEVSDGDVIGKQGNNRLAVTGWTAAQGDRAGLDLFILIDDSASTQLGMQLDDLRAFINEQPPTTSVGVGYMRNGTVQIT